MIENFSSLNPENLLFKIFIKRSQDATWIAAKQLNDWIAGDKYVYDIYKNNLWIYTENESIVDIMITY